MTYLAVPIKVVDPDQAGVALGQAVDAGAEMIELRLDFLAHPDPQTVRKVVTTAREKGKPVIATCRPPWEGGSFAGDESARYQILGAAVKAGADYLDIELACFDNPSFKLKNLLVSSSCKVIISNHDFDTKPADLTDRLKNIILHNPTVSKLAFRSHNINDNFAALDIIYEQNKAGRGVIALAMGQAGVISRLLARKLGAFLTFASLSEGFESAEGQLTVKKMRETYRWDHINAHTSIFGVIGFPIAHSISPAVHNAAFSETGFNGLYLPMPVEPAKEVFFDYVDGLIDRKWLDVRGLSVTIPHKQFALEYIRQRHGKLEPLAQKIGAVNTIIIDNCGEVSGYNTDYAGALDALTEALHIGRKELENMRTAVIGAGGVARAIVAGLSEYGCPVTIYNRTVAKAQRLADEFDCNYASLSELRDLSADLLVNATSIGMYPAIGATPVPAELLRKEMVVFDSVYNPIKTKLLCEAKQIGAKIIDGVSMFVNQASAQFELFTGRKAPLGLLRKVMEIQLGLNQLPD